MISFLPVTFVNGMFIGFKINCTTLIEAYLIYFAFRKFSYYLYEAKVAIKYDHVPLHKFPTVYT